MQEVFTSHQKSLHKVFEDICRLDNKITGISSAAFAKFGLKHLVPKTVLPKDLPYVFNS